MNSQPRDKKPTISEFEEPLLLDLISSIDILLFCNGISFEVKQIKNKEIFSCNKAKAIFEDGQLIILADSILPNIDERKDKINPDNNYYKEQIKNFESMISQFEEWESQGVVEKNNDDDYKVLIDLKL